MSMQTKAIASRFRIHIVILVLLVICTAAVFAQTDTTSGGLTAEEAGVKKYGLMAAAIAFGLGAIGASIAIAYVGSAAMGTLGEKPELASQALIFIALAEGLVVFGFITALMILGKV